ncbi:MAG: DUF2141 domain-containing protein [Rikenellaceae bacterium]
MKMAKFNRILCVGLFALFSICSVSAQKHEVKVVIDNVKSLNGKIYVAVFKDGNMKFLEEHQVDAACVSPKIGSVEVSFSLPSAKYAFVAFQDENGNMEMDSNWIGYPKEPFALSTDNLIPTYKAAEVDVSDSITVTLTLRGN